MRDTELPPLPPDLAALFAREARAHAVDDALAAKIAEGVTLGMALRAPATPSADGPSAPIEGGASGAAAAKGAAVKAGAVVLSKPLLAAALAGSFAVGASTGVVATRTTAPPVPSTVVPSAIVASGAPSAVAPPVASSIATPSASSVATPLASDTAIAAPSPSPAPSAAARPRNVDLRRERELVDAARSQVAARRGEEALVSLGEHARAFPAGQLAEEREALRVQALVVAGRGAEAEAAAVRFHQRFPQSTLGATVDASLRAR